MDQAPILNGGLSSLNFSRTNSNFFSQELQTPQLPYEVIHFKEGETIFRRGDMSKGLYYVQSGCVKMFVQQNQARGRTTSSDYVTRLVGANEYFGYKPIVRDGAAFVEAKAVKDSVIWLYNKQFVEAALNQAHPLVQTLLRQAVSEIESYEQTAQLHYLASVQERIAYQLVLLAERFGVKSEQGIHLSLKLTRNELAQLASTINESLSRHLTEFKNEGLIDLNGKEIIIKDKPALMLKSGNFDRF